MGWHPTTLALYEKGTFPSEANSQALKSLIIDRQI
ncbi:hypothetical protein [Lacticaseibacillus paracasei]|nr:hypothetical protein [Lacticaseibacillus paracasei]